MSDAVEVVKIVPEETASAPKPKRYDFSEVLKPGEDRSSVPGFEPGRAQGTGHCDGVIYLTGRKNPKDDSELLPDMFKQALRYVKPQPIDWLALNPGFVGRCKPVDLAAILGQEHNKEAAAEIVRVCEETAQGISWMFKTTKRSQEATIPANVGHWHVVKAEEGVWCVIWV